MTNVFAAVANELVSQKFDPHYNHWSGTPSLEIEAVRIFWKFTAEVCENEIRIYKDLSLWARIGGAGNWCRLLVERIELVEGSDYQNYGVFPNGDHLVFAGGYFEIQDSGLRNGIKILASKLNDMEITKTILEALNESEPSSPVNEDDVENDLFGMVVYSLGILEEQFEGEGFPKGSVDEDGLSNVGRNIYLEVDVDTSTFSGGPIFYYPQYLDQFNSPDSCQAVILYETQDFEAADTKRITWQIAWESKQDPEVIDLDPAGQVNLSRNYYTDGFNIIVVNQDKCGGSFFEYLVDAIPLSLEQIPPESNPCGFNDGPENGGSFPFSTREVTFYIGFNPDTGEVFEGKLRRLVFDPNASCPECT